MPKGAVVITCEWKNGTIYIMLNFKKVETIMKFNIGDFSGTIMEWSFYQVGPSKMQGCCMGNSILGSKSNKLTI